MKKIIMQMALLISVLAIVACSDNDNNENEVEEIQSFSSLVRDVFDDNKTNEPVSVVEGIDFKFEAADALETYSDLLNN